MEDKKREALDFINIGFTKKRGKIIRKYCFDNDMTLREYFRRADENYFSNVCKNNK